MKFNSILFAIAVLALLFGCAGSGPQPPQNVKASLAQGGILISWSPSPSQDVAGYNVYRSNSVGQLGGKLNAALINDVSYTDSGVQDGHTYYYTVHAVNSKGDEEKNTVQVAATAQIKPPGGLLLTINGGTQYTSSQAVTLTASATGASTCRFSNDQVSWGDWQQYATQVAWQLSAGDGQKTVYMACRNSADIESSSVSASILLKTTGPTITITAPNSGDTVPVHFSLSFTISDAMGQATCNAKADGATVPIGDVVEGKPNTVPLILSDGGHTLQVECTDAAGPSTSSAVHFEAEEQPVKLQINDGSGTTASTSATLHVFAPPSSQCRFSNDDISWSAWKPFASTTSWTLTSGTGSKTVYAQCQNADGVPAGNATDTVNFDSAPPYVSLTINNGELITYSRTVKLSVYASTSVTDCRFSGNGGSSYNSWAPYQQVTWYTLQGNDGTKMLAVQCRNAQGTPNTANAQITLQTTPSTPPTSLYITINGGASTTSSQYVSLALSARYADNCQLRNENGAWGGWEPYTTGRSWTLSTGEGNKIVFYQCNNQFGTSGVAQASITYGSGRPPMVTLVTPVDGQTYDESSVGIDFVPDGGSSPFLCTYYCNGVPNDAGSIRAGSHFSRTLIYEGMQFGSTCGVPEAGSRITTYATCTDNSGRTVQSSSATIVWTKWVGPLV